jgi:Uma2 family endonuclease
MPVIPPASKQSAKPLYLREQTSAPLSLHNGDSMTQEEFHAIYSLMPEDFRAELIEGEVFILCEPIGFDTHGRQDNDLAGWLATYRAETPAAISTGPATTILDGKNQVEPDVQMRINPEYGGKWTKEGKFVKGAPELAVEIAYSTRNIDLGRKKRTYQRNGVQEYLVYRTEDRAVDWWELQDGNYVPLPRSEDGSIASRVFPGLVLDVPALLRGDLKAVLDRQRTQLGHGPHAEFCKSLEKRRGASA